MECDSSLDPNTYQAKILQAFGDRVFDGGIFYLYPYSLRIDFQVIDPILKCFCVLMSDRRP
jgi:hypothetical protein